MNNGLKIFYRRVSLSRRASFLRLNCNRFLSSSTFLEIPTLEADNLLIRRADFRGITARQEKKRMTNPDIVLAKMQEFLRKNYRISADVILIDVIRQLEEGNEHLENLIFRSQERWFPLLISCCGHPISSVEKSVRNVILERLWSQLEKRVNPLPVYAWNARFRVLNENETEWDPVKLLNEMEKSGVEPTIESFHEIVKRIAHTGDVEGCKNMVYNMACRGFSVDAHINVCSVFVFSVRGHYKKADSLIEASTKYGADGEKMANGAAVLAAAYRGDTDRLRTVLKRSVIGKEKKLNIFCDDILETIWHMAEKSRDGSGLECSQLIEQMLNCTIRDQGFFRKLFREIERHICHRHYYSALSLLEDTKRVSDCLENQKKNLFLHQLVGRLSSQLIRNQEPVHVIRDIANRVHFEFNNKTLNNRIKMYDDLLYSTLMLKNMELDDRLEYFQFFADKIDAKRERIHVTLPLIIAETDLEQRLALLYRLCSIGYQEWSSIDIEPMVQMLLQPIYNSGRPHRDQTKLDKLGRILKSFGVSDKHIWRMLFNWSKLKEKEEVNRSEEEWIRPYSRDLRGWCRAYYSSTFESPIAVKQTIKVPYEKLKSCVKQGDVAKVTSILGKTENGGGWPTDTNFEEIVPEVIDLYLQHEPWKSVKKMLTDLSTFSIQWSNDPSKTPVKNFMILSILRRLVEEGDKLSVREIMDFAYELRTLFPSATCHYDGFFETQIEYKKLFSKCFERLEKSGLTTESVEELIDFLRSLIKLDIIQLHPSETLTVFFINILLRRMGWDMALCTWQNFLTSLHCPNGAIALLRYCLQNNTDLDRKNLQFVIHRGSTFLSQSRILAMYVAVLIGIRRFDEAEKACDQYSEQIEPQDCLMAMRLMNSLKARSFDDQFMLDYAAICLRRLKLADNIEAAQSMQADLLRISDQRHMGPAALRVYNLFSEYNIEMRNEEKQRLATAIEKHANLSKKWIFKPDGFLNLSQNDEIVVNSEEGKIVKKLKEDILSAKSLSAVAQ